MMMKRRTLAIVKVVPVALTVWTCSGDAPGPTAPELSPEGEPPGTSGVAASHDATLSPLVLDAFSRTESGGWGRADLGGAWRIDGHRLDDFLVNGAEGLIVKHDNLPRNAIASEGYAVDVAGRLSFSIDQAPDHRSRFYTVEVYARRDDRVSDGDNYYRFRVRAYGTGKMDVRLEKNVNAVSSWLSENRPISPDWAPGQKYWIRWEAMGTSPATTVRMRVWRHGDPEPSTWDAEATVNEPALDVIGTTGVRVSGPNGTEQRSYPLTYRIDDLEYGTPGTAPEPPANQAPTASAGGPYTATAGDTLRFDGTGSTDPDGHLPLTYAWTFGDGATGTGANPTHVYAAAGTYTVTLTVTDSLGLQSAPATSTATVGQAANAAPIADPGGPYTGTVGAAVRLDGTGSTDPDGDLPLTYAWNFGDGTTGTGATPSHTYAHPGDYTVTLTVTDAKGAASSVSGTTAAIAEAPNQAPVADAGGPYTGTAGSAVQLSGTGSTDPDGDLPLTYAWDFGDGATGTGATPSHTYAAAGSYTVTLVVTDSRGAPSAPSTATAEITASKPLSQLVLDRFGRTVSGGWGQPEIGGTWDVSSGYLADFRVNGAQGLITKRDGGPRNAVATEGYGTDVTGVASFSIDTPPDHPGTYYTVQVYARRNDLVSNGDNYYRYRVRAYGDGRMDVRVEKNVNGSTTWLSDIVPVAPSWRAGQKYWVRWECFGASPSTTLRMRVWRDGDPEPTGWDLSVSADEPRLDASGTTGVRFSGPNGTVQVTFPITLTFDDLDYRSIR